MDAWPVSPTSRVMSVQRDFMIQSGVKFGKLTTVKRIDDVYWICVCDCGRSRKVIEKNLKSGNSKSCGCARLRNGSSGALRHGESRGGRRTPEFSSWCGAHSRCENKNDKAYKHYGARGISVCDRWSGENGLLNFLNDMGRKPSSSHSLERINVNGNYCPENCKWGTPFEQANNTRRNVFIEYKGLRLTQSQWARKTGLSETIICIRRKSGLTGDALFAPLWPA